MQKSAPVRKDMQWEIPLRLLAELLGLALKPDVISRDAEVSACEKGYAVGDTAGLAGEAAWGTTQARCDDLRCRNQRLREKICSGRGHWTLYEAVYLIPY